MHTRRSPDPMLKSKASIVAIIGAAAMVVMPISASAQKPDSPMANSITKLGLPITDAELATIRGKFIRPDSISYFGISMLTSWQDENGITTIARLVFNVDFLNSGTNGNPVPQLMIGWVREGDPSMDVTDSHSGYTPLITAQQVLPVGAIGTTQGAVQANVIAGADNLARNNLQIALVPTSQIAQLDLAGLTAIDASTGFSFADGDRLEFRLGPNEVGVALSGNHGSDTSLQNIGGDFGRLLQQTMINSDGNTVLNNSAIIIGTDITAANFGAVRATEALSAMKGHGF
ncbi:MAG: hypothetical protein WC692_05500 [Erythrobacter sp.]